MHLTIHILMININNEGKITIKEKYDIKKITILLKF